MSILIPLDSVRAFSTQKIDLVDATFRIDMAWNGRDETWWMNLYTEQGDAIVVGTPLVPDWDLLGRYRDSRLPAGHFFAVDTSGAGLPPGRNDLGDRVQLVFFTDEEVAAL